MDLTSVLSQLTANNGQQTKIMDDMQTQLTAPPPTAQGGMYEEEMKKLYTPPATLDEEETIVTSWKDFTTKAKSDPNFRDMLFVFGAALASGGKDPLANMAKGLMAMKEIDKNRIEKSKEQNFRDRQLAIQQGEAGLRGREMDQRLLAQEEDRKFKGLELMLRQVEANKSNLMSVASLMIQGENLSLSKASAARGVASDKRDQERHDLTMQGLKKQINDANKAGYFELTPGDSPINALIKTTANTMLESEAVGPPRASGVITPTGALSAAMESVGKQMDKFPWLAGGKGQGIDLMPTAIRSHIAKAQKEAENNELGLSDTGVTNLNFVQTAIERAAAEVDSITKSGAAATAQGDAKNEVTPNPDGSYTITNKATGKKTVITKAQYEEALGAAAPK